MQQDLRLWKRGQKEMAISDQIWPFMIQDVEFEVNTTRYVLGTKEISVTYRYNKGTIINDHYCCASVLEDCYAFGCGDIKLKIDSDNVLNPKDLSTEDKTLLRMLNPQIPDFVWTIYYLMKDCLDSKISESELLDRLYLMVDNKPNF